jgi:ribulose-phosphate 3-epimerase
MNEKKNKKGKISLSMMCASIVALEKTIKLAEKENIDYLHIDIMDGSFVPNITLGTMYLQELRQITKIPIDLHLLVNKPEEKLDWFGIKKNDIVSVHWEASKNILKAIMGIKSLDAKAFIVLNPGTPIFVLDEIIDYIDGVVLMMINPGLAGRTMIDSCIPKIGRLRKYLKEHKKVHLPIEVDGNVSFANASKLKKQGANIFVAGTSSIFSGNNFSELAEKLRKCL